jgi:lipopolysaccharide/colanic/teichoic acid biosynthesis glycosyltransferase
MSKRLFDVAVASTALLLLTPLLLMLALWIKLDSPGPTLFRQTRVGRAGQPFRIRKFRTMRHDPLASEAEQAGLQLTVGEDKRITRAGRFLRRSKLDELPQLFDVLQGHMSLVGPRPEVPRYVALYPSELRDKVLSVRPGITDLASIEYRRESDLLAAATDPEREYREVVLPAKLQLAAQYVDQASLCFDLKLIWRTVAVVWGGRSG